MKQKQKDDEGQKDSDRQGDTDGQNNTKGRTGGDKGILDTAETIKKELQVEATDLPTSARLSSNNIRGENHNFEHSDPESDLH